MAVPKVITLPAQIERERLGLLNLTVNGFTRTAQITLAAADANGEPIRGGVQLSDVLAGTEFDAGLSALIDPFLSAVLQLFIARGKIAPGATVDDVKAVVSPAVVVP